MIGSIIELSRALSIGLNQQCLTMLICGYKSVFFRWYFFSKNSPNFSNNILENLNNSSVMNSLQHGSFLKSTSSVACLLAVYSLYPPWRFSANNSIYKKATSFIALGLKIQGSLYVCQVSYPLIPFEGSFQCLKLRL